MPGDHPNIPDWGADLDHENRPGVPMERLPPQADREPPEQQACTVEILHSIEREGITPVFGTSVPPRGCSGRIRRVAFRHSENDVRHWMLLLLADRVNVIEGMAREVRTSPRVRTAAIVGACAIAACWGFKHGHKRRSR
ncbi:hypothetical protein ISP15_03220 [Dyella jejuensis]|uniref:Uncharacterized protein n=1 Tax=Dyella jejuensis TaxID=1432009 RepID=A0ABW8JGB9_9GAMM